MRSNCLRGVALWNQFTFMYSSSSWSLFLTYYLNSSKCFIFIVYEVDMLPISFSQLKPLHFKRVNMLLQSVSFVGCHQKSLDIISTTSWTDSFCQRRAIWIAVNQPKASYIYILFALFSRFAWKFSHSMYECSLSKKKWFIVGIST